MCIFDKNIFLIGAQKFLLLLLPTLESLDFKGFLGNKTIVTELKILLLSIKSCYLWRKYGRKNQENV